MLILNLIFANKDSTKVVIISEICKSVSELDMTILLCHRSVFVSKTDMKAYKIVVPLQCN